MATLTLFKISPATIAIYLLILLHHTTSSSSSSTAETYLNDDCPMDCFCSIEPTHSYNHAKCTSLEGLKVVGKTSAIHSLDLSNNEIIKITTQLDKLTNLTKLDLSYNRLSEVTKLSKRIKDLNLSHNRITSGKLSKIPLYVEHLNLSYNDITYLPVEFMNLAHLKSVELLGNPINCTCETLQVRNWLQDRVWTDNHVQCSSPLHHKGKPWLQVKQDDICGGGGGGESVDQNDVMLGDQPYTDEGSGEIVEDELNKEFIPLTSGSAAPKVDETPIDLDAYDGSGDEEDTVLVRSNLLYEGSGDESENNLTRLSTETEAPAEDEGSGSGAGLLIVPIPKVFDYDNTTDAVELTNAPPPLKIFLGNNVHRFDDQSTASPSPTPVEESEVGAVRVIDNGQGTSESDVSGKISNGQVSEIVVPLAEKQEAQSTYILLAILGVLLLCLIAFVVVRKKNANRRNRRSKADVENPTATEMLDMNKQLLGKPVNRNGNGNVEIIPLMGNKEKWDAPKPATINSDDLKRAQEPLLQKLNANENTKPNENAQEEKPGNGNIPNGKETNNNANDEQIQQPSAPQEPAPQIQINNNPDDEVFLPISPKTSRYSPVYSPETGRVKIKLTEMPKPRTPMLITRSRSNAGEIITTPVRPAPK